MTVIDLKDQFAVVTGGARGIGYAIAEHLLASGASCALWDRDASTLATAADRLAAHRVVHPITVDVSSA
jgi:3-oxoacyl-[acyl-carrier protein] reductase